MARTVTQSQPTHHGIRKQRRAKVVVDWRQHRNALIHREDVVFEESAATRARRGVYIGAEGDRPAKALDATSGNRSASPTRP